MILDRRCILDISPRRQCGADAGTLYLRVLESVSVTLNHRE